MVLIHGLGTSSITWSDNIAPLAEHFTVYALDLPGHGGSDNLAIDYTIATGMRVIDGFLERVGVERAAFVGNSIGGLLALRYALELPARVSHLVLVDAAGLGRSIPWWLRLTAVPGVGELLHSRSIVTINGLAKRLFEMPERIERRVLTALHRARTDHVAHEAIVKWRERARDFEGSGTVSTSCPAWAGSRLRCWWSGAVATAFSPWTTPERWHGAFPRSGSKSSLKSATGRTWRRPRGSTPWW